CAKSFIEAQSDAFERKSRTAILEFHPRWVHAEPMALSMMAAWGAWCQRNGYQIRAENLGKQAAYAARMKVFQHLGVNFNRVVTEHEEAGRFLPVTQVRRQEEATAVIEHFRYFAFGRRPREFGCRPVLHQRIASQCT